MICPCCNNTLSISNTHGVEIDFCPNCRGVWLDRGELEKILERSNSYETNYRGHNEEYGQHSEYGHHERNSEHQYGNGHYPKRKKGFLSDLFDF